MIEQYPDAPVSAPWWMAGGLFAAWAIREVWGALRERRKVRTETDANVELLDELRKGLSSHGERLRLMEEQQAVLRLRLDEEIALRMAAQEEAHRLRLRVLTLESAMRSIGAVIPKESGE